MNKSCPHCSKPVPSGCVTCTRSECQQAEYDANIQRNKEHKLRRRR